MLTSAVGGEDVDGGVIGQARVSQVWTSVIGQ
jgi:hypothetical protein